METGKNLKNIYEGSPELKSFVKDRYKSMFEKMLDLVEDFILVSDPSNGQKVFANVRSKILRQGNNALRELEETFKQYSIKERIKVHDKIDFGKNAESQEKEEEHGQGK